MCLGGPDGASSDGDMCSVGTVGVARGGQYHGTRTVCRSLWWYDYNQRDSFVSVGSLPVRL